MIDIYFRIDSTLATRVDSFNERLDESLPSLTVGKAVSLDIAFFENSSSTVPMTSEQLALIASWKLSFDSDFNPYTSPMLRLVDAVTVGVNSLHLEISSFNAQSIREWLGNATDAQIWVELAGIPFGSTVPSIVLQWQMTVRNRVDGEGEGALPSSAPEYYSATQIDAMLASSLKFSFSSDGENWHLTQSSDDEYFRIRNGAYEGALWSDAIAIPKGNEGQEGVRGSRWYAGEGISGTTIVNSYSSGIDMAVPGDMYVNTVSRLLYICVAGGPPSSAVWHYCCSVAGPKGDAGVSSYCYVAYASSSSGADFSLQPAQNLKYRAEIHSPVEIQSPTIANFTGARWMKYIGDDGQVTFESLTPEQREQTRGPEGSAATVSVGSVSSLPAGSLPTVVNSGTSNAAVLVFGIPNGSKGDNGSAATITVRNVSTGSVGEQAKVTNAGTSNAAILDFVIPRGETGAAFTVNAAGLLADRSSYDSEQAGFSFLATNTGNLYIKNTAASGDWSDPIPFKGDRGDAGSAATIEIGNVTSGASPSVVNRGTSNAAILDFVLQTGPQGSSGSKGDKGDAATIAVGNVSSAAYGTQPSVVNVGTSNAAVFDFILPCGPQGSSGASATVSVGYVSTGSAGTTASVVNTGTGNAAIFNFTIPKGDKGDGGSAATVQIGSITTVDPSQQANVVNTGDVHAAVLDFTIPRGSNGLQGQAATVTVGTVSTGSAGTQASVVNVGTSNAAVLNFVIPKGDKGDPGADGTYGQAKLYAKKYALIFG